MNGDENSIKYVTVIDMAIKALEDNIKLNKQNIGSIVTLDRFPNTKWVLCNGWFMNNDIM